MIVHITGVSGFIGNDLSKYLKKKQINFVGYSRRIIPNTIQVKSYSDIIPKNGDVLIHLAQNSFAELVDPVDEINTLKSLSKKNWKHIIYASSSAVYGNYGEKPHLTNESVIEYNNYTKVKIECEKIIKKIRGTSLRFTNIYGPSMKDDTVLGEIKSQIDNPIKNKILLNELDSIKDFIFIDDVISSIYMSLLKEPRTILNVGTGVPISIKQLVENVLIVVKKFDFKIEGKKKLKKLSINSVNIDETKSILGWQPRTKILNGLKIYLSN